MKWDYTMYHTIVQIYLILTREKRIHYAHIFEVILRLAQVRVVFLLATEGARAHLTKFRQLKPAV